MVKKKVKRKRAKKWIERWYFGMRREPCRKLMFASAVGNSVSSGD